MLAGAWISALQWGVSPLGVSVLEGRGTAVDFVVEGIKKDMSKSRPSVIVF